MLRRQWAGPWLAAWVVLAVAGCGDDAHDVDASGKRKDAAPAERDAAPGAAGEPCKPARGCDDIEIGGQSMHACCSPATACGYELPALDDATRMLFPQAEEFFAQVTKGDPTGRCAPESWFFGPRPGLYEHRVTVEGGEDILITPQCEAYTVLAYILPGCCLPDDSCGLSTDESWTTLEYLAEGVEAPFTKPECVPAEVLNQQFTDSVVLAPFARTTASGSCNHAELDATLPP